MPPRIHELKTQLRRAGFVQHRGKGSRTIWTHPDLPGQRLTISGNDDDVDGRCQEQAIRKMVARLPAGNRSAAKAQVTT
jgi:predicted RNA binding protein YcfA (HicA-like mRNA interferase family)